MRFLDSLAPDICWTIMGTTPWSGTYRGREAVRTTLIAPLFAQFADRYVSRLHRIIAEGDAVVVECRGEVMTKAGKRYDNSYCWVCRIEDDKIVELTEYLDTGLVASALAPPSAA